MLHGKGLEGHLQQMLTGHRWPPLVNEYFLCCLCNLLRKEVLAFSITMEKMHQDTVSELEPTCQILRFPLGKGTQIQETTEAVIMVTGVTIVTRKQAG